MLFLLSQNEIKNDISILIPGHNNSFLITNLNNLMMYCVRKQVAYSDLVEWLQIF